MSQYKETLLSKEIIFFTTAHMVSFFGVRLALQLKLKLNCLLEKAVFRKTLNIKFP